MKKTIAFIVVAAIIAGAYFMLTNQDTKQQKRSGSVKAVLAPAIKMREFSDRYEAFGNTAADESITITANVTEYIDEILFTEGEQVTAGTPLVRLQQAEEVALLKQAKASLKDQEREVTRLQPLVKRGSASKNELDARITERDRANYRVAEIEARLADRTLSAPFDGTLGLRRVSPGALVNSNTIITTLDKIDRIKIDFTLPTAFARELNTGDRVTVDIPDLDRTYTANIMSLDSRADSVSRTLTVRAAVDNQDRKLRAGMLAYTLVEQNRRQAPAVLESAIIAIGAKQYVLKLDADNLVERIEVGVGTRFDSYVEITNGLKAGDRVITDGVNSVRIGETVTIREAK